MTSMITGLPDRYRPLDEVGPDEVTATGVIRCWRAKDRVLNRDVAIRVHTPGGAAAHDWIARALTAGGLATPALAMVYDAAEGDDASAESGAAYVVNEWIDGETLAQRLARGPLPERETRLVMRRLAEGVAEAHRVGLALGGLTPELVVLRPNGLVGVRAVPAAAGTIQGDITALGTLLEACLTGRVGGGRIAQADLAALVRRARSTEPGQSLSSAAAMAALLADRPRAGRGSGPTTEPTRGPEPDNGWLRRLRERSPEAPGGSPRTRVLGESAAAAGASAAGASDFSAASPAPPEPHAVPAASLAADLLPPHGEGRPGQGSRPVGRHEVGQDDEGIDHDAFGHAVPVPGTFGPDVLGPDTFTREVFDEGPATEDGLDPQVRHRRQLMTVGMPILALVVVIGLAWWLGSSVLSVTSSVDNVHGSTPPAVTSSAAKPSTAAQGQPVSITTASVFDPFGDGQSENDNKVGLSYDGNPGTVWDTLQYKRAAFGNLKPGVGVLYDLGSPKQLSGATITTTIPGATMEVRVGDQPQGKLDAFQVVGSETVDASTDIRFTKSVTTRYVLVWITNLAQTDKGYQADIAELTLHAAG